MVKILNLILYNNNGAYNGMRQVLRKYLSHTDNKFFFYCFDENITENYVIDGDMILIKGKETFIPGIFLKTVKAIEIVLQYEFDYLLRSNISTIVDHINLNNYLSSTDIKYGGSGIITLNWLDPPYGIRDHRYRGTKYAHGTGIILSRAMAQMMIDNKDKLNYDVIDDVSIGLFFGSHGIQPQGLSKGYLYCHNINYYTPNVVFYRNKRRNREDDVKVMKNITETLINNLKTNKTKEQCSTATDIINADTDPNTCHIYYGCDGVYLDVSNDAISRFIVNGRLIIPKNIEFNTLFGDPYYGQQKVLVVKINGKKHTIDEHRTENIDIKL
jgi:hypothetical protein